MSSVNISHSVCIFCYRTHNNFSNTKRSLDVAISFLKYLGRFVNYNGQMESELFIIDQLNTSSDSMISICAECESSASKFCEVYHQLKCLELELEWKLDNLLKIIILGGKVPSRVSRLKFILQEAFVNEKEKADAIRIIQHFRNCVVKNGRKRLNKRQPQVLIKRIPNVCTGQEEFEANLTNNNYTDVLMLEKTNVSICSETNDDDGEFIDPTIYQEETSQNPDSSFVSTTSDQFENEDDNHDDDLQFVSDQMNTDSSESPKEPQNQTADKSVTVNDNLEKKFETGNIPTQPILNAIPNCHYQETTNSKNIEISNDEIKLTSSHLINLKTETGNLHRNSADVTAKLNDECLEADTTDKKAHQVIIVDERCRENDATSTSNTVKSLQQIYNLREHEKSRIVIPAEFSSVVDDDNEYHGSSTTSTSSDSSSDNETNDVANNTETKQGGRPKRVNHKQQNNFKCFKNECSAVFQDEKTYQNHKSLHRDGKFHCNFCDVVEINLAKLSSHEYKTHLPNETKKEDLNHRISRGRRWTCPRCNRECSCVTAYQAHFACVHFRVGEEHEADYLRTKLKKKRKCKQQKSSVSVQKVQKCDICQKIFSNLSNLLNHKLEYHNFKGSNSSKDKSKINDPNLSVTSDNMETSKTLLTKLKCHFCDMVHGNAHDLAVHETEHAVRVEVTDGKKYKCPRCPFMYNLLGVYLKHHSQSHLNISSRDLPGACNMCSSESVFILNSKEHYDRHHNLELLESSNEAVKCDVCSAYFLKDYQLYIHKTKIHVGANHKCEFCEKVFETRKRLLNHKNIMHKYHDEDPALPFGCDMDECKKRYDNKYELDYHKRFHKSIELSQIRGKRDATKCRKCGLVCESKQALAKHKSTRLSRKLVCQQCGKTFKNRQVLEGHLEYHKSPEEWKFQCAECGKKCADKYKLDEHKRTHTKEKPFVCQFCGEKYAHRHNWRNHLKTKHGDEEGAQEDIIGKQVRPKHASFLSRKGSKKGDCIIAGKSTEHNN